MCVYSEQIKPFMPQPLKLIDFRVTFTAFTSGQILKILKECDTRRQKCHEQCTQWFDKATMLTIKSVKNIFL